MLLLRQHQQTQPYLTMMRAERWLLVNKHTRRVERRVSFKSFHQVTLQVARGIGKQGKKGHP